MVSGTIIRLRSAVGRKPPGGTRPRSGCRQRMSASADLASSETASTIGW